MQIINQAQITGLVKLISQAHSCRFTYSFTFKVPIIKIQAIKSNVKMLKVISSYSFPFHYYILTCFPFHLQLLVEGCYCFIHINQFLRFCTTIAFYFELCCLNALEVSLPSVVSNLFFVNLCYHHLRKKLSLLILINQLAFIRVFFMELKRFSCFVLVFIFVFVFPTGFTCFDIEQLGH